jgi:hypothetical protein
MASVETHPYDYSDSQYNDFQKKGHPGRYLKSIRCDAGTTTFTGSNFGAGGIIVPTGSTGTASFSGGGTVPLASLSANNPNLYEFSLESVKVDSGTVYVLIKNTTIW